MENELFTTDSAKEYINLSFGKRRTWRMTVEDTSGAPEGCGRMRGDQ